MHFQKEINKLKDQQIANEQLRKARTAYQTAHLSQKVLEKRQHRLFDKASKNHQYN